MRRVTNGIKHIIVLLFNPLSPVIVLVLSFFINIITSSNNVPTFIKNLRNKDNINNILIFLAIWFFATLVYYLIQTKFNEYEKQINDLNVSLKEKERQIEQNSGVILNKYGELARFNKKQRFYDLLKSFVEDHSMIQNAQLYSYTTKIEHDNTVKIKLKFEEGYVYENVETNAILQSYFQLKLKTFKNINDIVGLWKSVCGQDENSAEIITNCLEKEFLQKIHETIKDIIDELNGISDVKSCKEEHYSLYRTALVLLNVLYCFYEGIETDNILQNTDIEDYLLNTKRTGVLGTILLKDNYVFKHDGKSLKNGRMYASFYFRIYNENYILLVSIPPNELSDEVKWDKELLKLRNDFISRIQFTSK